MPDSIKHNNSIELIIAEKAKTITKTKSIIGMSEKCKKILRDNYDQKCFFTVPSNNLYPHQWSWDSCWISYAYCILGEYEKAEKELLSLFNYQWINGLVPSIVFHKNICLTSK